MDYIIYKMKFHGAVHFGKHSLEDGEAGCYADTLFSALCCEALKMGESVLNSFYKYAKGGALVLSDAFPYTGSTFFLPKPMIQIGTGEEKGNSIVKKAFKKLKYIPMNLLATYLTGEYDVLKSPGTEGLGHFDMKVSASIQEEEKTEPYRIGTYYFNEGNGLYVIIGYEKQESLNLMEKLWNSLSYSGIGGRRSSGMGRFSFCTSKLPADFRERLERESSRYMSLAVSLPREDELNAVLDGASYTLCRRSGFVASDTYAVEQRRKRDLYVFVSGSCFTSRYEGDIYNVSDDQGNHPVYRYARSLLLGVDK